MAPDTPLPLPAYLREMVARGASDLFLRADSPPAFRVHGRIVRSDLAAPSPEGMRGYLGEVLTPLARERFDRSPDVDVAHHLPGTGRFRLNLFLHQGSLGLAARFIPPGPVRFETLNLPRTVLGLAEARRGLVLVAGPTGCGKSTTLAALVHRVNATREDHIVTIEDPIEFVHEEIRALVHQRQVGCDTASFAEALKHVVRQSPDVILIGEMRDRETVETALAAALTGHLILSTLHTTSAVQSIDRILNLFPPESRRQAQSDLALTLVGIVAMRLLPRKDGAGRVPAVEILTGTPTVRRLVADGKFSELPEVMKRSPDAGMVTLTASLERLCREGLVEESEAIRHAPNAGEFRLHMRGLYTGIDSIDRRTEEAEEEAR